VEYQGQVHFVEIELLVGLFLQKIRRLFMTVGPNFYWFVFIARRRYCKACCQLAGELQLQACDASSHSSRL